MPLTLVKFSYEAIISLNQCLPIAVKYPVILREDGGKRVEDGGLQMDEEELR